MMLVIDFMALQSQRGTPLEEMFNMPAHLVVPGIYSRPLEYLEADHVSAVERIAAQVARWEPVLRERLMAELIYSHVMTPGNWFAVAGASHGFGYVELGMRPRPNAWHCMLAMLWDVMQSFCADDGMTEWGIRMLMARDFLFQLYYVKKRETDA